MPRRDPALEGPHVATLEDIPAINQLFSDAFTDRYQRDGMAGVRVPPLNPAIWRYSLEDAGTGALVWRGADGVVAAFNIAHCSGREGWMGPLAVRPDLQGRGLGSDVVRAGISWLRAQGAGTVGLETMPRTVDNIGFYSRLGFLPGHLTLSLTRPAARTRAPGTSRLGARAVEAAALGEAMAALTDARAPGVDFTREVALTMELGLGDVTLLEAGGHLAGFALWHAAPLAAGRAAEEIRVLKLVAGDEAQLLALLDAVGAEASARGLARVTLRAQGAYARAYGQLIAAGFSVQWTDLRMTLEGAPESPAAPPAIVYSNWEI